MNVRAHLLVSGRVQGVFFRANTKEKARDLEVTGWVKNRDDGKVEAVFEGDKGNVNKMIDFCKKGSPAAEVSDVEVNWEDYKGDFSNFEILY